MKKMIVVLSILFSGCRSTEPASEIMMIDGELDVNNRYPAVINFASGTGTLIAPNIVLTAAHILQGGTLIFEDANGQEHRPVRIYDRGLVGDEVLEGLQRDMAGTADKDIAIAVFEHPLGTSTMKFRTNSYPGDKAFKAIVVGYGMSNKGHRGKRQFANVSPSYHPKLGKKSYCKKGLPSPDVGDSGGPLIVNSPNGDAIVGVTSFTNSLQGESRLACWTNIATPENLELFRKAGLLH